MSEGTDKFIYKPAADSVLASFTKELPFEDSDITTMQTVISAMTGTSVDVKVEQSLDGGTNWHDVAGLTQAQFTGVGSKLDKSSGTHVAGRTRLNVTMTAITALTIEFYVNSHGH